MIALLVVCSDVLAASTTSSPDTFAVSIDRQPLDGALQELARQCDVQVVFFSRVTEGLSAPAIRGNYTLAAAMDQLLTGSGLISRVINPQMVEVQPQQTRPVERRERAEKSSKPDVESAQDQSAALQEVVVVGLAEQLVATRIATPLRDIPQTISIVTGAQMRQGNQFTLADVLENAAGITTERQSSVDQAFYARAFRISAYHIDGGAAVDPQFDPNQLAGALFLGTPDMVEFDHVEILRGADALFSGDGNPGGAISLVRKRPQRNFALTFSASGGSWGSLRDEVDVTGPIALGGDLRGRLAAVYSRDGYFYDIDPHEKKKVFAALEYDVSAAATVTGGVSYQWDKAEVLTSGLPFYADGRDSRFPRSTALLFDWDRYRSNLFGAYAQYRQELAPTWALKFNASHWRAEARFALPGVQGLIDPVTNQLNAEPEADFSANPEIHIQNTTDITVTGTLDWLGLREEVAVGGDFTRVTVSSLNNGYLLMPLGDPRTFDPSDFPDPRLSGPPDFALSTNANSDRYGMFGSMRVYFDQAWSLVGGARISGDRTEVDFGIPDTPLTITTVGRTNHVVTPYAGLMYSLSRHYSLYASYADIYLAQNGLIERSPGDLLSPIHGVNLEAGIKGEWRDGALNASAAVFRIEQSNLPQQTSSPPGQALDDPQCCASPVSATSKGVDMGVSGEILPGWSLGFGYTYNVYESPPSHPLSTVTPKHLLKAWTDVRLPGELNRWHVGGGLRAQSKILSIDSPICTVLATECTPAIGVQPAYAVLDLRTAFDVDSHWRIAFSLNNALDKRYYESIDLLQGWYGRPRNWMLRFDGKY